MLTQEQNSVVHDHFLLLAERCHQEIEQAAEGKGQLADDLEKAEISLISLQEDYEKLQKENEKLASQKSSVSADISKLRSDLRSLQDQKKMLEVRLSQTQTLTQQKDEEVQSLQKEKLKLEERFKTSEKRWKNEFGRLEREWEGKVAMATQAHELLLDSKEALESDKLELEQKLCEIEHENQQLTLVQSELENRVLVLERDLSTLNTKCAEKEELITNSKSAIARLLTEKALLGAEVRLVSESLEAKLAQVRQDSAGEVEVAKREKNDLSESLQLLESERTGLLEKLAQVTKKEVEIDSLTTKVTVLTDEKHHLETEVQLLTDKHAKAQQDIQLLVDSEERRQLDNEKLKMTLTTEIELLKSKLKILEESRDSEGSKDKPGSAFQPVSQSRPLEQLLKPRGSLQGEGKPMSSRLALAELQSRLTSLEVENTQLKEAASGEWAGHTVTHTHTCIHLYTCPFICDHNSGVLVYLYVPVLYTLYTVYMLNIYIYM